MANESISAISGSGSGNLDPTQATTYNNDTITSMLVNGNLDPKFATMLLNQMTSNNVNSILFGSESNNETSSTAFMDFGLDSTSSSNTSSNVNDILGVSSNTYVTPQFQMSVYSSLIGKTVTAINPSTGKEITDKVTSVQMQNGSVMININGIIVPPANLTKIKK
jgi:hypothetical protein